MGTRNRWRTWLVGYALIGIAFGLAWWNNPPNIGDVQEAQRAWLAFALAAVGICILVPPLATRPEYEVGAQRTLIVCLAVFMALGLWWTGYLPSDPFGCSRVNAPDCHTTTATRWRAFAEVSAAWVLAFALTHAVGNFLERRKRAGAVSTTR